MINANHKRHAPKTYCLCIYLETHDTFLSVVKFGFVLQFAHAQVDSIYIYIYSYIYYIICRVCLWAYSGEWATRMTDKVSARSRVLKIYIQL